MGSLSGFPVLTAGLLPMASNVYMTSAWYAHLKSRSGKYGFYAAMASWGIALLEYLLQCRRSASATRR